MSASNNTVKSFALGYKVTSATLDAASIATTAVGDAATATKDVSTGFLAGVRFALAERRGEPAVPSTKDDDSARKLREAQALYARAHGTTHEAPASAQDTPIVTPNGG